MKGTHVSRKAAVRQHKRTWCNHEGCTELADDWECRYSLDNAVVLHLCYEHAKQWGMCLYCGYFMAGIEDFDFSSHPGYCRDCWEEINDDQGLDEYGDSYADFDDYDPIYDEEDVFDDDGE